MTPPAAIRIALVALVILSPGFSGCGGADDVATPLVMTESPHDHYHVHAADASHGHAHEDGAKLEHDHLHLHDP